MRERDCLTDCDNRGDLCWFVSLISALRRACFRRSSFDGDFFLDLFPGDIEQTPEGGMSLVESVGGTEDDLLVLPSLEELRVVSRGAQVFRMKSVSKKS